MPTTSKTPKSKDKAMVALSFRIPKKLHEELKRLAIAQERSTSWFIVRQLRNLAEAK